MPASKDKQAEVAERRAKVIARRSRGIPPTVIARELGVTEEVVWKDVHEELSKRRNELNAHRDLLIAQQVEELDQIRMIAWRNALTRHYQVSLQTGKVARDPVTDEPLLDTAPVDRALALVIRAQERLSKLLALDEPQKVNVKAEVVTLDAFDAAIDAARRQLEAERGRAAGGFGGAPGGVAAHPDGTRSAAGGPVPGELPA